MRLAPNTPACVPPSVCPVMQVNFFLSCSCFLFTYMLVASVKIRARSQTSRCIECTRPSADELRDVIIKLDETHLTPGALLLYWWRTVLYRARARTSSIYSIGHTSAAQPAPRGPLCSLNCVPIASAGGHTHTHTHGPGGQPTLGPHVSDSPALSPAGRACPWWAPTGRIGHEGQRNKLTG